MSKRSGTMPKKKKRIEKKVTVGGKRVSVYGYSAYEIQEKIEELKKQEDKKRYPLFRTVADDWYEAHSREVEYYTAECYKSPLNDVQKEFGDIRITDITALDCQAYIKRYAQLGYKQQTVKLRRSVLRQVFDYAILQGYITVNPCIAVSIPKNVKKGTRTLPPEEDIAKIKEHKRDYFGLFPFFVLYTGMRREEALAIMWNDIDFENNTITVNKVIVFESNKSVIRNYTKTESGDRIVPLLAPLKQELLRIKHKDNDFVFKSEKGLMNKGTFDYSFNRYRKLYGIQCTVHQLRHEFATICYDAELDVKDAQAIMGHSKESVTRDIYTHIRNSRQKAIAEKLNNFVSA